MGYPVNVSASVPEKSSRGILILRALFVMIYVGIPHLFCLYFRMIATGFVNIVAWFAVLFTGKYPKKMFDFNTGTLRWMNNVMSYMFILNDTYPKFSGKETDYPLSVQFEYPEKLSRGILILRFFSLIYVGIPHGFCLFFRMIATSIVVFIAGWAVLFTGKYPPKMHHFVLGTLKWETRVSAYMMFMTDTYPPFNTKE